MPGELSNPFYWAPFALIGEGGAAQRTTALVEERPPLL